MVGKTGTSKADIERLRVATLRDLINRVNSNALGNSDRKLKHVAIDLIHASGKSFAEVAAGAFLAKTTVTNLATEKTQFPRVDTIERVLTYFDMAVDIRGELVKPAYMNKPKK